MNLKEQSLWNGKLSMIKPAIGSAKAEFQSKGLKSWDWRFQSSTGTVWWAKKMNSWGAKASVCNVHCQNSHNSGCQRLLLHSVPIQINHRIPTNMFSNWCHTAKDNKVKAPILDAVRSHFQWARRGSSLCCNANYIEVTIQMSPAKFKIRHLMAHIWSLSQLDFVCTRPPLLVIQVFNQTHAVRTYMHTFSFAACSHCVDSLRATCWWVAYAHRHCAVCM